MPSAATSSGPWTVTHSQPLRAAGGARRGRWSAGRRGRMLNPPAGAERRRRRGCCTSACWYSWTAPDGFECPERNSPSQAESAGEGRPGARPLHGMGRGCWSAGLLAGYATRGPGLLLAGAAQQSRPSEVGDQCSKPWPSVSARCSGAPRRRRRLPRREASQNPGDLIQAPSSSTPAGSRPADGARKTSTSRPARWGRWPASPSPPREPGRRSTPGHS